MNPRHDDVTLALVSVKPRSRKFNVPDTENRIQISRAAAAAAAAPAADAAAAAAAEVDQLKGDDLVLTVPFFASQPRSEIADPIRKAIAMSITVTSSIQSNAS